MKIDGVLLDIDNTLYDYNKCHKAALDSVLGLLAKQRLAEKEGLFSFYQKARLQINTELSQTASSHNRALYFQRMLEMLDVNAVKHTLQCYELYWDKFLNNLEVYDGVYKFLESIKDRRICLISDLTALIQHRKIQKMNLYDYAKFIVTSEEAGREKPDPQIFKLALKKLGLGPHQVCMVGDDYEKDILGATRIEIKSFWSNRRNEKKQLNGLVTEFKSFKELTGYLK